MRLIDADKLKIRETWALVENVSNTPNGISFAPLSCVLKKDIDDAPTVFSCNACKNMGNERECVDCHDYSNYVHYEERPQGEWIPVSERLPEENVCDDGYHEPSKWVLVQAKNGLMYTTRYWTRDKKNVWTDLEYPDDIIAWQELPEPYKEGGAE